MKAEDLRSPLVAGGFIPADAAPPEDIESGRPWFVALLLGISGWLAGIFLIVFVGMLFTPTTTAGWAAASIVCFGAAFALYAIDRESAFFDQFALALWITGQCAFVGVMTEVTRSEAAVAGGVAALQCVLAFATPNRLARLIASFFACIAWGLALRFGFWDDNFFASNDKPVRVSEAVLGALLIWVPVIAFAATLLAKERRWLALGKQHIYRPILSGLLLGLCFGALATHPEAAFPVWTDPRAYNNWIALLPLMAACYAGFALYCAFKLRHRGLMGAAIAGALLHLLQFYYMLGLSLMTKSFIMLIVGTLMLIMAATLRGKEAS
jgi:hypothetical protein